MILEWVSTRTRMKHISEFNYYCTLYKSPLSRSSHTVTVKINPFSDQKNPRIETSERMQEKKVEKPANKNPKKTNLLDHNSIKHILDESVTEVCEFFNAFSWSNFFFFVVLSNVSSFFFRLNCWIGRIALDYELFSLFWL